jgi:cytochrome c oxidase cbb3-type subunit 1
VLVPLDFRSFVWPHAARPWVRAAIVWGALLAITGTAQFLPGALAAGRFTHLLVAHSHLAMAGLTSSAGFLLLELGLARDSRWGLFGGWVFALWQGATALHLAALVAAGALEAADPATMLRGSAALSAALGLRWLAGAIALTATSFAIARVFAPARSAQPASGRRAPWAEAA